MSRVSPNSPRDGSRNLDNNPSAHSEDSCRLSEDVNRRVDVLNDVLEERTVKYSVAEWQFAYVGNDKCVDYEDRNHMVQIDHETARKVQPATSGAEIE